MDERLSKNVYAFQFSKHLGIYTEYLVQIKELISSKSGFHFPESYLKHRHET